jgi:two-component system response regulator FixJ
VSESRLLIYVADDDDGVRRSLEMLLDGAGYRVAAFASGEAMLAGLDAGEPPACAVVDVRMGDGMMTGLDVQRTLSSRPGLAFPVIIVTGHGDVPLAVAAMRLGVANFIEKPFPPDSLLDAVAEAVSVVASRPRELPALTPREKAVLTALVGGLSNKEIARELGISHRTVEVHRASLMTRLGARNLAEAVRMGLAAGLSQGG